MNENRSIAPVFGITMLTVARSIVEFAFQNTFHRVNQRYLYSKRIRNDLVHTREVLAAFWPRFSLFLFIVSRCCGVTVTAESASMQGFHFANCKSKFVVFKRCHSIDKGQLK